MNALATELLELLQLEQLDDNRFLGESRNIVGGRVFGGQVLGQALAAAARTVNGRTAHSLQAYFLLPGDVQAPIVYQVERIRDGGRFTTRRVSATQKNHTIFELSASFQLPEAGLEHQDDMPAAPAPEELIDDLEARRQALESEPISANFRAALLRPQLIETRPVAPDHPLRPQNRASAKHVWIRIAGPLPDDPGLHQTLLAYASDHGLLGAALQPHGLTFLNRELQAASLDHAMWFHRPCRMDEWLLYSMDSPIASGGRGYTRGQIFTRDGQLVASVAQEGVMRLRT